MKLRVRQEIKVFKCWSICCLASKKDIRKLNKMLTDGQESKIIYKKATGYVVRTMIFPWDSFHS